MKAVPLYKIRESLFLLFILFVVNGYSNTYTYKHFTTAEGLSHNTINCFTEDNDGYIWIGTTNGINRFDGYDFKKYYFDPQDSLSLKGRQINDIKVDVNGVLWVATEYGLFYFNPKFESFHKINVFTQKDYYAKRICIDSSGFIWSIVNDNYLVRVNGNSPDISKLIVIDSLINKEENNNYYSVEYYDGYLWLNGSNGVFRYDYAQRNITNVFPENTYSLNIQKIKRGKPHEIIVVIGNKGIYKINTQTLAYTFITKDEFNFNTTGLLFTTDAEYNNYGDLLVGGLPGLFIIQENQKIERFNKSDPFSSEFNKIICNCLNRDKAGNIWVGTMYNGVFLINNEPNLFSQLALQVKNIDGIHVKEILDIGDKLYVNNFYGAFSIDKHTNKISTILDFPILSINKYTENVIIISSITDIYEYNIKTKSINKIVSTTPLYCTYTDSRGIIWVSHWGQGLEGIDLKTLKRYSISIDNSNENKNTVYTMLEDSDSSLWLGTFGSGLVHIQNPLSESYIKNIYSLKGEKESFGYDVILSMYDDKNGSIWIGTDGSGMRRFYKAGKQFDIFNIDNGLISDFIVAINGDNKGNIWFTSSVLSKYDIKAKSFTHFDLSDGVSSLFYTTTSAKDENFLYFGDDKGILAFNPDKVRKHNDISMPLFTGVKLFGVSVNTREKYENYMPFPVSIGYADKIELPHNMNSISFEFASINPLNSNYIEYSYMLEGTENKWIPLNAGSHSVTYSGLQPGNYTFKVKASVMRGIWSKTNALPVIINPPWWQNPWLKVSVILFLLLSTILIVMHRFRTINHQKKFLEQKVQERTQKLKHANEIMKEDNLVIEMKNRQLNDVLVSKDKLISILAHDFKNPLQGIVGFSQLLQKESVKRDRDKFDKYLNIIIRSANILGNQMLKVLDWVKSQDQNMVASPIEINLEVLLNDVVSLENVSAQKKNITVSVATDYRSNAFVDSHMINTVFRNLLSNAIKFTEIGGTILIGITEEDDFLNTTFIDEGVGIPVSTIENLFNSNESLKSSFGTSNEKGTGLGLQLCKTYIEKNSGIFSIAKGNVKGSEFKVLLPKGKTIATKTNKL